MKFLQKSLLSLSVAAISALAIAGQASALVVVQSWDYEVTTIFTGATWAEKNSDGIQFAAGATGTVGVWGPNVAEDFQVLSWGGAGNYHGAPQERSALTLDLSNPVTGSVDTDGLPSLATSSITHHNHVISSLEDRLATATISSVLNLNALVPDLEPGFDLDPLIFNINFAETSNGGACTIGTNPCPDIFVLTGGLESLSQTFSMDQITYEVSIFPLVGTLFGLPSGACGLASAASPCIGFTTAEGQDTTLTFGFLITQVPEPGTLSLLGLGLVGGAVLRRRKTA